MEFINLRTRLAKMRGTIDERMAAVLDHAAHFKNHRVGVILTGGNVDLDNLPI